MKKVDMLQPVLKIGPKTPKLRLFEKNYECCNVYVVFSRKNRTLIIKSEQIIIKGRVRYRVAIFNCVCSTVVMAVMTLQQIISLFSK